MRTVLDAVPQHVDRSTPADLPLKARKEVAAGRAIDIELDRVDQVLLGREKESAQLSQVDAKLALVVARVTEEPPSPAGYGRGRFGGHVLRRQHISASRHRA